MDERAVTLAKIVLDYSLSLKAGDTLLIRSEDAHREFAEKMSELCRARGATPLVFYHNLDDTRALIERCDPAELDELAQTLCRLAEQATAASRIYGDTNPMCLDGVDPEKIMQFTSSVSAPLRDRITGDGKRWPGIRWNLCAYPTEAAAKASGLTFEQYSDFLFTSCIKDWEKESARMEHIKSLFDAADLVRIVAKDTDLTLSLKGRGGEVCAGKFNLPDGEVFYGPVEESAEGHIYFPYDSRYEGSRVSGMKLVYKQGKVMSLSAESNQGFLEEVLNLPGARRLGEFGIGCNQDIRTYTGDGLFDEKIGGTIHLALGDSYKEPLTSGGGLNDSRIHWDVVCDLRKSNGLPGGELHVDGKCVQRNGVWIDSL